MKLFGVTGGIGMGKSTSAKLLAERGVAVIDTDDLARRVVDIEQPALQEIKNTFGAEVIGADGKLLRAKMAEKVFSSPDELRKLESILHPRIREIWKNETARWKDEGRVFGAVIIPLLFETSAQSEFDAVICVACSAATQRQRLRERKWSDEQINQRLSAQWPIEQKIAQSDFVVWTDVSIKAHAEQLDRILRRD